MYSPFVHLGHGFLKFSLIIQLRQKGSGQSYVTLIYNAQVHTTFTLNHRNSYVSVRLKSTDIFTPFYYIGQNESKYLGFSGVQRHSYNCSNFKSNLYVVTYYKVTSLHRKCFFMS